MDSGLWLLGFIAPVNHCLNPGLKRRVAAGLAIVAVGARLGGVAAHPPAVERPVVVAAEHAGLLQLGEIALDLGRRRADQIGELRRADRPRVDQQRAMRPRLVHQAQHLDPQAARRQRAHPQHRIGPPVGGEEFEPGLLHVVSKRVGRSLLPLVGEGGPAKRGRMRVLSAWLELPGAPHPSRPIALKEIIGEVAPCPRAFPATKPRSPASCGAT